MATLSGSIEADVPLAFADREWREFVGRSMTGSFPSEYADLASSIAETDADDGVVKFEKEGDRQVKVSVELEYTPRGAADGAAQTTKAQQRLELDLEKFRTFVLRRCDELQCRAG